MIRHRKKTFESSYKGLPILTDKDKNLGCYEDMLEILKQQFDEAHEKQTRTFIVRYDVRFPSNHQCHSHSDNKLISEFNADYMKALRREDFKPQYFMTREQSREKHQHHHGILLLEGKKVHSISTPLDIAERIWHHKLGLPPPTGKFFQKDTSHEHLIDACIRDRQGNIVPNGIMIRKDDPEHEEKLKECFKRASYLCKINTKGHTAKGQREVFASRITHVAKGTK